MQQRKDLVDHREQELDHSQEQEELRIDLEEELLHRMSQGREHRKERELCRS